MARRSATNERYQKHTGPSGKTRKSAAAAKPKRATGAAPAPTKSKSSGKPSKSVLTAPPTQEYRRWRRLWWYLLGAALVLTTASWALREYIPSLNVMVSSVLLGAAYASIFTALYIDWTKLRRMRTEWVKAGRPDGDPGAAKSKKVTAEKTTSKKLTVEETTTDTVSTKTDSDTTS